MVQVVLYSTTSAATLKVKTDITKIRHILDAKKVPYEEVDLASTPERRASMLAGSEGLLALPQLHVDGRLVGVADSVQELEDWGELDALLRGEASAAPAAAQ
ncbi:hypothetical protein ACKKBG_A27870 [Auxenochlorella protothecoides x Auxenochlorella symbiontica]|uniref:Glutaredoxin-1 n=1 Tax=Auxenochlorella protothecoides TaxID=3075 RepID=A0A087SGJ1_AUXPR|nr:Glutaredoxin-1 [Auxenochlorella protothecoides]KFM24845.1 Glutaredoxin-1 [Auxenochlorella protothecoides]